MNALSNAATWVVLAGALTPRWYHQDANLFSGPSSPRVTPNHGAATGAAAAKRARRRRRNIAKHPRGAQ